MCDWRERFDVTPDMQSMWECVTASPKIPVLGPDTDPEDEDDEEGWLGDNTLPI